MKSPLDMTIVLFSLILIATLSHCYIQENSNNYDYFATTECLKEPLPAQYGGGIVFVKKLVNGSKFLQRVQLKNGLYYVLSAWIQVSEGSENVITSTLRYPSGVIVKAGSVIAKHGCWTMLKGGIVANVTTPADIIFQANNGSTEIWVENVSLQPFTAEQWRSHQEESISKLRKRKISLKISDARDTNKTLRGAKVIINKGKSNFPFGCAMTNNIINNPSYQNWFASRFKVTTFRNEMKWYSNEPVQQGKENYGDSDTMVSFAQQHGIAVRAHNIFWDDPKYQPSWVKGLNPSQLQAAVNTRIKSVMSRYKGKVIAWDVVNENLHFRFFEDKLGNDFSKNMYAWAHQLDGATLFMNEYNTVEESRDPTSLPQNYINKLWDIHGSVGGAPIGIGLQSHFGDSEPNIAYMRSALDTLGATGMPIWLTEVDTKPSPNQPQYLEQILWEGFSHPAVQGIVLWSGPAVDGYVMTLADNNFANTPVGDVVDKLINQWRSGVQELTTDANGSLEVSLFHGDYDVTIVHPLTNSSTTLHVNTDDGFQADERFHMHIHV